MTSAFLTLMKGQGHTTRSKVTDVEVSAFSECFLLMILSLWISIPMSENKFQFVVSWWVFLCSTFTKWKKKNFTNTFVWSVFFFCEIKKQYMLWFHFTATGSYITFRFIEFQEKNRYRVVCGQYRGKMITIEYLTYHKVNITCKRWQTWRCLRSLNASC